MPLEKPCRQEGGWRAAPQVGTQQWRLPRPLPIVIRALQAVWGARRRRCAPFLPPPVNRNPAPTHLRAHSHPAAVDVCPYAQPAEGLRHRVRCVLSVQARPATRADQSKHASWHPWAARCSAAQHNGQPQQWCVHHVVAATAPGGACLRNSGSQLKATKGVPLALKASEVWSVPSPKAPCARVRQAVPFQAMTVSFLLSRGASLVPAGSPCPSAGRRKPSDEVEQCRLRPKAGSAQAAALHSTGPHSLCAA